MENDKPITLYQYIVEIQAKHGIVRLSITACNMHDMIDQVLEHSKRYASCPARVTVGRSNFFITI